MTESTDAPSDPDGDADTAAAPTSTEAQEIHDLRRGLESEHDPIGCWCCCDDCDFDYDAVVAADRAAGAKLLRRGLWGPWDG